MKTLKTSCIFHISLTICFYCFGNKSLFRVNEAIILLIPRNLNKATIIKNVH